MPIHIRAKSEDLAPYVLLPGDPERAEFIANKYLSNVKLYTSYRKMFGFTGEYKGIRVSVQTSGMGTPSASIIISELAQLGVKAITRVGTVGGLQKFLNLSDIILVSSAWSSREIVEEITNLKDFVPSSTAKIFKNTLFTAETTKSTKLHIGPIASVNLFYRADPDFNPKLTALGCLGCEMESAALFALAAVHGFEASCLLTVSDLIHGKPEDFVRASDEKISEGVDSMVKLALDSFIALENDN